MCISFAICLLSATIAVGASRVPIDGNGNPHLSSSSNSPSETAKLSVKSSVQKALSHKLTTSLTTKTHGVSPASLVTQTKKKVQDKSRLRGTPNAPKKKKMTDRDYLIWGMDLNSVPMSWDGIVHDKEYTNSQCAQICCTYGQRAALDHSPVQSLVFTTLCDASIPWQHGCSKSKYRQEKTGKNLFGETIYSRSCQCDCVFNLVGSGLNAAHYKYKRTDTLNTLIYGEEVASV